MPNDDEDSFVMIDDDDGDTGTDEDDCQRHGCSHNRRAHDGGSGACEACDCRRFLDR